jgi:hypothetical protein
MENLIDLNNHQKEVKKRKRRVSVSHKQSGKGKTQKTQSVRWV